MKNLKKNSFFNDNYKMVNYLFGISFKVTYILLVIFYFVAAVRKYSVFFVNKLRNVLNR